MVLVKLVSRTQRLNKNKVHSMCNVTGRCPWWLTAVTPNLRRRNEAGVSSSRSPELQSKTLYKKTNVSRTVVHPFKHSGWVQG